MSFSIDPKITNKDVALYASQLDKLEDKEDVLKRMEKHFSGNQSTEFYRGLLTGYITAFSVVEQSEGGRTGKELGLIIAFIASKMDELDDNLASIN